MEVTKNNQYITNLINSLLISKVDLSGTSFYLPTTKRNFLTPKKILCDYVNMALHQNGGFTISINGLVPIYGYALSIYKDRERKYNTLNRYDVAEYLEANTDLLKRPNHFLGGWKFQNHIYLDVSIVLQSLEKAKHLAQKHGQIAIFSLYENVEFSNDAFKNFT